MCKYLATLSLLLLSLNASPIWAQGFAEGYSSELPGEPARISNRAFTIYTKQDVCLASDTPTRFQLHQSAISLKVGDKIYRGGRTTLVIEAYGEDGRFLPKVPIELLVIQESDILASRSDWDYLEALNEGTAEILIRGSCTGEQNIDVRIMVNIKQL